MSKLATWLLNNRLLVLALTGTVVVLGILSWNRLPIDAFPDVTNTQVMILTKAPGLAPVDVEQRVSYPIELKMRGLPKVKLVRSLSKSELSQVVIIFEDDADVYWTRQVVFERLAEVREELPPGIEPEMGPDGVIVHYRFVELFLFLPSLGLKFSDESGVSVGLGGPSRRPAGEADDFGGDPRIQRSTLYRRYHPLDIRRADPLQRPGRDHCRR